jgi:hypothetical protein
VGVFEEIGWDSFLFSEKNHQGVLKIAHLILAAIFHNKDKPQ